MSSADEKPLAQGKTKAIFATENPEHVLVRSLDALTAFNAKRKNEITGKGAIATRTTCNVFRYLNAVGLRTHFVREVGEGEFIAERCEMIPIEWVARRVATGSFLKRNPGVQEGYTFKPVKLETFFKDDANDDPQWSDEQILTKGFAFNGRTIDELEVEWMKRQTAVVFRLLEHAWQREGCVLVDLKIEFGVNAKGEVVLADVIDNDSWRVWPNGDRRLQLDKQFYRDLPEVTDEALKELKKNYEKVADLTAHFVKSAKSTRVVIVMGSAADKDHSTKIAKEAQRYGVGHVHLHVCSAHKSTAEALKLIAKYEDDGVPTVFVAVAGRSNGLGPVISGNTTHAVINAPPCSADWAAQDVWSSLRMPSGIGCTTALGPEEAGLAAAKILSASDHLIFAKILAAQSNNVRKIFDAEKATESK